jgi:hypothetical protein
LFSGRLKIIAKLFLEHDGVALQIKVSRAAALLKLPRKIVFEE